MANHTPRAGKRQPKTLIRELNEWLKTDGLQVVDWGRHEINPPPKSKRYFLETIGDDPDWDLIENLDSLHEEMGRKYAPRSQNA